MINADSLNYSVTIKLGLASLFGRDAVMVLNLVSWLLFF